MKISSVHYRFAWIGILLLLTTGCTPRITPSEHPAARSFVYGSGKPVSKPQTGVLIHGRTPFPVIANVDPSRGPSGNGWDENKWNGFGKYHALIIANQEYSNGFRKLEAPKRDAVALKEVIARRYDFDEIKIMEDGTAEDIFNALRQYRENLDKNDNLLIYYAGHGTMDEGTKRGYWIPVDGRQGYPLSWLSTEDVTNEIKMMQANHVLVIADSCYSGAFISRGESEPDRTGQGWVRIYANKRSRKMISSGDLQRVEDSRSGGHSIFASALLEVLETDDDYLDSAKLFVSLIRKVGNESKQRPLYGEIPQADDDGGLFIFVPKTKGSVE